MASLGTMLAGSAIGQGAGQFVHQQAQGAFDRQRLDQTQAQNDFSQNQMSRTLQQQGIEDQTTDGTTDEDRLNQLADIAGKANRGDLQRKYQSMAKEARQNLQMTSIANASRAITLGQFQPAAQMLNKTGLFGDIHSIGIAPDVEQDPHNPTYAVYTAGAPDANGNPTQGPPVHVTQQMLYQLQAKPGDALHWMAYSQNMGQKNDIADRNLDIKSAHYDAQDNHWQRQDAAAMQKAKSMGAGGTGKLTDKRWLYQWAQSQIGKPGGFQDDSEAMKWAMDPNRQNKDYWQSMRAAGQVANAGGLFSVSDIKGIAEALRPSPIGNPPVQPPAPAPPPAPPAPRAAPDFKAVGFEQDSKTGNWRNPKTGVWFKADDKGNTFAWSNTQKTWVPAQ